MLGNEFAALVASLRVPEQAAPRTFSLTIALPLVDLPSEARAAIVEPLDRLHRGRPVLARSRRGLRRVIVTGTSTLRSWRTWTSTWMSTFAMICRLRAKRASRTPPLPRSSRSTPRCPACTPARVTVCTSSFTSRTATIGRKRRCMGASFLHRARRGALRCRRPLCGDRFSSRVCACACVATCRRTRTAPLCRSVGEWRYYVCVSGRVWPHSSMYACVIPPLTHGTAKWGLSKSFHRYLRTRTRTGDEFRQHLCGRPIAPRT
jgi:hypothetical protein